MTKSLDTYLFSNISFFIISTGIFILLVPIGTICHELGHIISAKLLGYSTQLHYASMDWFHHDMGSAGYLDEHKIIVIFSGVMQTLLTGSLGFYLSLKKTKSIRWIGIYLTFFWSRQIANLIIQFLRAWLTPRHIFEGQGDEVLLSELMGLPRGFFSITLGIIGLALCSYVVFYRIPSKRRIPFILSGVIGTTVGYIIWFILIGPAILP